MSFAERAKKQGQGNGLIKGNSLNQECGRGTRLRRDPWTVKGPEEDSVKSNLIKK